MKCRRIRRVKHGRLKKLTKSLPEAEVIGEVVRQKGEARVIIDGAGYRQDKVA